MKIFLMIIVFVQCLANSAFAVECKIFKGGASVPAETIVFASTIPENKPFQTLQYQMTDLGLAVTITNFPDKGSVLLNWINVKAKTESSSSIGFDKNGEISSSYSFVESIFYMEDFPLVSGNQVLRVNCKQ